MRLFLRLFRLYAGRRNRAGRLDGKDLAAFFSCHSHIAFTTKIFQRLLAHYYFAVHTRALTASMNPRGEYLCSSSLDNLCITIHDSAVDALPTCM